MSIHFLFFLNFWNYSRSNNTVIFILESSLQTYLKLYKNTFLSLEVFPLNKSSHFSYLLDKISNKSIKVCWEPVSVKFKLQSHIFAIHRIDLPNFLFRHFTPPAVQGCLFAWRLRYANWGISTSIKSLKFAKQHLD